MPGPDWESEDEENQTIKQDDVGVVIRTRPYGIVKVVWSSGKVQWHCYGFKNILEVQAYRRRLPSVRYVPMIHNPKAEIRANDKKQQGPPPTQETIQLSESTTGTTNSMPLVVNSVTEQTKTLSSSNDVSTISNKPKRNKNVTLCATPNRSRSNSFSLPQVSSPRDRVVWQHRMRDKSWKDFPIDISDKVEHIFLKNPSGTLLFDQNGQPYKIIPSTLQLIHLSTKTTSKIRRILQ